MFVIGIAGGTGSGKTTLVKRIQANFMEKQVCFLHQDSYYKDNSHVPEENREEINFDHPDSVEFDLLTKHVRELKAGNPVYQPTYSYLTCTRQKEVRITEPKPVIILEGILIYTYPPLVDLIDLKVFLDADDSERLSRVIQRDMDERGRTAAMVLDRFEKTVRPMHLQFIEPSKKHADIIIPNGGKNETAVSILLNTIETKIR